MSNLNRLDQRELLGHIDACIEILDEHERFTNGRYKAGPIGEDVHEYLSENNFSMEELSEMGLYNLAKLFE